MSASETGDEAPLVQFFKSVRNSDSASWPASRTVSFSSRVSRARDAACAPSASAKGQSLDPHGWCIDAITELQVVGGHHRLEHVQQMRGDRHLADGVGDLAVLDPETRCAAAVVAGDAI